MSHPYGNIINLVCFYNVADGEGKQFNGPWVMDVPADEVINCYNDWEPALKELLQARITLLSILTSFLKVRYAVSGEAKSLGNSRCRASSNLCFQTRCSAR